ncbi:hypothetical protein [Thermomonospora cellulosilytica]|uniref:Uncharacterized protein n=1 Tax=Thermomonospora cellulosilytica TaxID=1411118 RepID=A0A7W3MXU3_9ACTN|nr:hypothetical protein [Thermomonospora cellulosilytica]MBA9003831.1 hypothetical protein [Thermomonospora cellulosilytica]
MSETARLYDAAGDRLQDLPPGPLHLHVHGNGLRAFVMADVLRRVLARRRRRVLTTRSGPPPQDWRPADHNIPDFDEGDPATAHVVIAERPVPASHLVLTPALEHVPADADPVTLRLAILRTRYREPVNVAEELEAARPRLGRWRTLMAQWADSPGRPLNRPYADEAEAALTDDLDTPAALAILERLADDPDVAPGSKLETFIHLDLLLALDLVSEIGRH